MMDDGMRVRECADVGQDSSDLPTIKTLSEGQI